MKKSNWKKFMVLGLTIASLSCAEAASVAIDFGQYGYVYTSYTSSTVNQRLAAGSYFAFGSFNSPFDPSTITQANILSTLRDSANWFLSFEAAYLDSKDISYRIANATAGIADNQYAYAVYINDTLANVRNALNNAAVAAAGISTQFGVFTYTNTDPTLRADLPRDPGVAPDPSDFSTEYGLGQDMNNFAPVAGKGSLVGGEGVVLIPEPSSASLLCLGIALLTLCRPTRKSA